MPSHITQYTFTTTSTTQTTLNLTLSQIIIIININIIISSLCIYLASVSVFNTVATLTAGGYTASDFVVYLETEESTRHMVHDSDGAFQ